MTSEYGSIANDGAQGNNAEHTPFENNVITPLKIDMLLKASKEASENPDSSGGLRIDGMVVDIVSLVGRVVKTNRSANRKHITIDDGSGLLEFFINLRYETDSSELLDDVDLESENSYIRVVIRIEFFTDKDGTEVVYNVQQLNQVRNINQRSFHQASIVLASLMRTGQFNHESRISKDPPQKRETNNLMKGETVFDYMERMTQKLSKPIAMASIEKVFKGKLDKDDLEDEIKQLINEGKINQLPGMNRMFRVN